MLTLSAILVLALAACGPAALTPDTGVAGTPGVSGTAVVGTPSVDLTGTPALGTSLTGTPSVDLTGTPALGTDLTGTPSVDLTGTPSTDLTGTPSVDLTGTPSTDLTGTPSVDLTGTPSAMTTGTAVVPVTGGPAAVNVATDPTLGQILVDGNGMTLYTFANDTTGVSNCTGTCLTNWPPLMTVGTPVAGPGVDATQLSTISATSTTGTPSAGGTGVTSTPSGTGDTTGAGMIVTYKGMPLYTYIQDTKPGDVNGNNVGGVWKVAVP